MTASMFIRTMIEASIYMMEPIVISITTMTMMITATITTIVVIFQEDVPKEQVTTFFLSRNVKIMVVSGNPLTINTHTSHPLLRLNFRSKGILR